MSKRRHNFGTKRFKEKSLFIFHARIALKSLILLFVRLIARGARIGKTHTDTLTDTQTHRQTHRQNKYCNPRACTPRVNYQCKISWNKALTFGVGSIQLSFRIYIPLCSPNTCKYVFNPNVTTFHSNFAEGLHFSAFILSVCVFFPILAPRAIRRTKSSICDFSAIWA